MSATQTAKTTRASKPANTNTISKDKFAEAQEMKQDERELRQKYPDGRIVVGSLRPGKKHGFGTKRVVDIKCKCGTVRTIATSDVFHCHGRCVECVRKDRNAARAERNGKPAKKTKK